MQTIWTCCLREYSRYLGYFVSDRWWVGDSVESCQQRQHCRYCPRKEVLQGGCTCTNSTPPQTQSCLQHLRPLERLLTLSKLGSMTQQAAAKTSDFAELTTTSTKYRVSYYVISIMMLWLASRKAMQELSRGTLHMCGFKAGTVRVITVMTWLVV